MKQDKAVTSPQPTPARNADRKWRFDAVCETFTFENGGGQIWHHGVHAGVRYDITVSSDAGLKPLLRGSRVVSAIILGLFCHQMPNTKIPDNLTLSGIENLIKWYESDLSNRTGYLTSLPEMTWDKYCSKVISPASSFRHQSLQVSETARPSMRREISAVCIDCSMECPINERHHLSETL